jgi:transposase
MKKHNRVYVGCDLGDRYTEMAVLDGEGAVLETMRAKTTRAGLQASLRRYERARVVIEVGTHTRWVAAVLRELGHDVVIANPRQVHLISRRRHKTDQSDAMLLARLGRVDLELLAPVKLRSRTAQVDLAVIRTRDLLVCTRTKLLNHIRGSLKQYGIIMKRASCFSSVFKDAKAAIPAELEPALRPVVAALEVIDAQIDAQDVVIEQIAAALPQVPRMTQVSGVGTLTATAFALTIDDPHRFKKSRFAGAVLGLTPAKDQSGDSDPQKRNTKAGDALVRKLLVQCAHHLIGHNGQDSDLKRWGLRLSERGGKNARKRAIVAVARKLAVLMHRLWITGEDYQPFGYHRAGAAA